MQTFFSSKFIFFVILCVPLQLNAERFLPRECPYSNYHGGGFFASEASAASAFAHVQSSQSVNQPQYTDNSIKKFCINPPEICNNSSKSYRSFDGSCNNLYHPGYGMTNSKYSRMHQPAYGDGIYTPSESIKGNALPNARLLSLSVFGDQTVEDDFRTLALMQWGQLVAHDISLFAKSEAKECCSNYGNKLCYSIKLHPFDPISYKTGKKCINFARALSDVDINCQSSELSHAEKISTVTAHLDLSSVYGNSISENQKIRQFTGGLLKTSLIENRQWLPVSNNIDKNCDESHNQCYSIPDHRNQFIPTIIVLHTILLREHNRVASIIGQLNPHYSDEEIFQIARKITTAEYQKITYYDWLPLLIGPSFAYANQLIYPVQYGEEHLDDYDPNINSAPYAEFSAAALRYFHNLIPGWFSLISADRYYNQTMRLSDYFSRPENIEFISHGDNFDSIIRGLTTQLQKRADRNIDKEIKHYFDRKPFEQMGEDLRAIDIQRQRDFGIASYNNIRYICGLDQAVDWSGFSNEISVENIEILKKYYDTPDDVELIIGGSLESHVGDGILGPTFRCIIGKQFIKTRKGDRFFFENNNIFTRFTNEQLKEIRKASLSTLICNNADYIQSIQTNSFVFPNLSNQFIDCKFIKNPDLTKWKNALNSFY